MIVDGKTCRLHGFAGHAFTLTVLEMIAAEILKAPSTQRQSRNYLFRFGVPCQRHQVKLVNGHGLIEVIEPDLFGSEASGVTVPVHELTRCPPERLLVTVLGLNVFERGQPVDLFYSIMFPIEQFARRKDDLKVIEVDLPLDLHSL